MPKTCECTARNELLRKVLEHDLQQSQDNIERGGSTWGMRANNALLALTRYLLGTYILDPNNVLEEVTTKVNGYLQADLRIFTLEVDCYSSKETEKVRARMTAEAKQYAVPVFTAADKLREPDVVLLCHILADALKRVSLPNTGSGDFQATNTAVCEHLL